MGDVVVTVELPGAVVEHLQDTARRQQRTVPEIVRELVVRQTTELPQLPPDVEAELAAFASLSDGVLWLLARTTLSAEEQRELAQLNEEAQRRPLSPTEEARQQALVDNYDRMLVRRAHAAGLLQRRGYDYRESRLSWT